MMNCCCTGDTSVGIIGPASSGLSRNTYIYIEGNFLQIVDDDPRIPTKSIPINFCPKCGRKLDGQIRRFSA